MVVGCFGRRGMHLTGQSLHSRSSSSAPLCTASGHGASQRIPGRLAGKIGNFQKIFTVFKIRKKIGSSIFF